MTNDYTIPQREVLAQQKANQLAQELGMTHAGDKDCRATITHTGSGTRVVVQRLTDGVSRSFKFNNSSLTAEQVDSARQDRSAPHVSTPLPWAYGQNQGEIFSPATGRTVCSLPVFLNTDTKQNADYILRAANALPAVEARLAEAVDLIRRSYAQSQEAEPGCTCKWCCEMRAFLEMNGGVE